MSVGNPNELFAEISRTQVPVIVFVDTGPLPHVLLVVGYDEDVVIVNDPFFDEAEISVPFDNFVKAWGLNGNYMIVIKKRKA